MSGKPYSLGRRQAGVDRNRAAVLAAARDVLTGPRALSLGAVARAAGVSRLTIYHQFGSRDGLLTALRTASTPTAPTEPAAGDARSALELYLRAAALRWAADPALFRRLETGGAPSSARELAAQLSNEDQLRPGCSIKEAEDVIELLSSFATFDRLHQDGRRTPSAVASILMRLAAGILS
jgi:AcrR family transcriptional regulator